MVAVELENVSKRFRRQTVQAHTSLKTVLLDSLRRRLRPHTDSTFQALRGITLTVQRGQTLGVIGRNGSGKSTLLKLLAGIYRPDHGRIAVYGKVGALLELGAGFHPEFSGRENVFLNGVVLGLSKREVRRRFDEIVRFAELEASIDEPVKTYSSGMYMRLGFSVAVHSDPDILLIDEILAVGDEAFQQKCSDKIGAFQRQGKTIIFVSHDLAAVERWSDETLWLGEGTMQELGATRRVIELYRHGMSAHGGRAATAEHLQTEGQDCGASLEKPANRWGSQEVEILSVRIMDAAGQERCIYRTGEAMRVAFRYKLHCRVEEPAFEIGIFRSDGLCCYGCNTGLEGISVSSLLKDGSVEMFLERLELVAGNYYLDVAVYGRDGLVYDYHHRLYPFAVKSDDRQVGVLTIPHRWVINASMSPQAEPIISY